jgi:Tol biopolymer transport system component
VAFWSDATNLEPGVTNGRSHLYLAFTRATKIAGKSYRAGQVIGSIAESADFGAGKLSFAWMPRRPGDTDSSKLVFITADRNVVDGDPAPGSGPWAYVADFVDSTATRLPLQQPSEIVPSPNGKLFAFRTEYRYQQNENNYDDDIWVYDPAAPSNRDLFAVSADVNGNLPVSNGGPTKSTTPVWAPDNQRVAFTSFASLVGSDTNLADDIYVKNFKTGAISRASTNARGAQANAPSGYPAWSPDGTKLAFQSEADNLITTDSNVKSDIFVKVLSTGQIIPVSVSRSGRYPIVGDSRYPVWSPDGQRIAFESSAVASELLPAPLLDANLRDDIYVKNIRTGLVQLVSIRSDLKQGNSSSDLFYVRGVSSNVWTPDGRALLFMSASTNFSASTSNGFGDDLFLKSL